MHWEQRACDLTAGRPLPSKGLTGDTNFLRTNSLLPDTPTHWCNYGTILFISPFHHTIFYLFYPNEYVRNFNKGVKQFATISMR